jgi:hypothetical protein
MLDYIGRQGWWAKLGDKVGYELEARFDMTGNMLWYDLATWLGFVNYDLATMLSVTWLQDCRLKFFSFFPSQPSSIHHVSLFFK